VLRFVGDYKSPLLDVFAMSKAFTRDENEGPEIPDVPPTASLIAPGEKNYITAQGAQNLRDELQRLVEVTRPDLAEARSAEIVAPPSGALDVVRFGACVTVRESDGSETSYGIVGVDETDAKENRVSWMSPIAKALLNRKRGERIRFKFPSGEETLEIIEIIYE